MGNILVSRQCITVEFDSGAKALIRAHITEDTLDVFVSEDVRIRTSYSKKEPPKRVPPKQRRKRMHDGGK